MKNATWTQLEEEVDDFCFGVSQESEVEEQEQPEETTFCRDLRVGVKMLKSGGCAGPPRMSD